jgi:hypothetical protein
VAARSVQTKAHISRQKRHWMRRPAVVSFNPSEPGYQLICPKAATFRCSFRRAKAIVKDLRNVTTQHLCFDSDVGGARPFRLTGRLADGGACLSRMAPCGAVRSGDIGVQFDLLASRLCAQARVGNRIVCTGGKSTPVRRSFEALKQPEALLAAQFEKAHPNPSGRNRPHLMTTLRFTSRK